MTQLERWKALAEIENDRARQNWDPVEIHNPLTGASRPNPSVASRRRKVLAAYEAGRSCKQISEAMNLNLNNVKSDLKYARLMRQREAMQ